MHKANRNLDLCARCSAAATCRFPAVAAIRFMMRAAKRKSLRCFLPQPPGLWRCVRIFGALLFMVVTATASHAEPVLRPAVGTLVSFAFNKPVPLGRLGFSAGYNLEFEPLILLPELTASASLGDDVFASRILAGLRAGFAGPVEPAIVLRLGYGNMLTSAAGAERWLHGFGFQPGFALDYRLSRSLSLGGELYYDLLVVAQDDTDTLGHAMGASLTLSWAL